MARNSFPFFVVCTGRCGTTTLVRILRMHPDVCALNAPRPHLSVEAFAKWADPLHKDKILNKIRRKRSNLITQILNNDYVYVEASNYCANLIEELNELYHCGFIHLYCDGRDFVGRGLAKDWYERKLFRHELQAWLRRRFLADIGRTRVDHQLPPPKELRTRVEKIAWLWAELNRTMLRYLSRIPEDRKYSLRLEGLNRDVLMDLHNFLGVTIIPGVLDRMTDLLERTIRESAGSIPYPYKEWTATEKEQFACVAGDTMKILGYGV